MALKFFSIQKFFKLILLIFCSFPVILDAQQVNLGGLIKDAETGELLIGSTVYNKTNQVGNISNQYGYFTIPLMNNTENIIQFSFTGYILKQINIYQSTDTFIEINLTPSIHNISEVIVSGIQETRIENKTNLGKIEIPLSRINMLPSISGEADILKAFQYIPGIQASSEMSNGLFVRGGTPDQNLFLIDDIPLYNVSHLGSFFSVFDPSIINNITFYKGGFPSKYGGRLSAIIDIRYKDGNLFDFKKEITLNSFVSKIFIEAPIVKNKVSFAFSARRSNFGIYSLIYNYFDQSNIKHSYNFYDLNFKTKIKLSKRNYLSMTNYLGNDVIFFKEKNETSIIDSIKRISTSELKWGNLALGLNWVHFFKNNNILNNITFSFSKYKYLNSMNSKNESINSNFTIAEEFKLTSGVQDLTLKNEIEFSKKNIKFNAGTAFIKHSFIPSNLHWIKKIELNNEPNIIENQEQNYLIKSNDFALFAQIETVFLKKFNSKTGIRYNNYFINGKFFPSVEPQINFNYNFIKNTSVKFSYMSVQQGIHFISNSGTGMPSDLWLPATEMLKPEQSRQISAGIAHTFMNNFEVSIESYYKVINYLIEYKEGTQIYNMSETWEKKVENNGTGKVKGIEFLINKKDGILTGWLGFLIIFITENLNI